MSPLSCDPSALLTSECACALGTSVSTALAAQSLHPEPPIIPAPEVGLAQKALGAGVPAQLVLAGWSLACL